MFEHSPNIRRLIGMIDIIEGYNPQLRKGGKAQGALPAAEAAHKLLFLTMT